MFYIVLLKQLKASFQDSLANYIESWDCLNSNKQLFHYTANRETKSQLIQPLLPSQVSWILAKRMNAICISKLGKCTFKYQTIKQFLDLDDNNKTIALTYTKGEAWLKHIRHFNIFTTRLTKLITNYTLMGKYKKRFFPNKLFICLCQKASIKTRHYILYKCEYHKQSQNLLYSFINDIITFLEFNPRVFSFQNNIS